MAFAAVVFDMDGTLLDTERLYRAASQSAVADLGYSGSGAFWQSLIGLPGSESQKLFRGEFGAGFPFREFDERVRHHRQALFAAGVPPKPGAVALLARCAELGLACAVATSAQRGTAEMHLARAGLRASLAAVVGRDDVARAKPYPDVFQCAAERLCVAPEACLAVEDSPAGVRAAHAARMVVAMVPDLVVPDTAVHALCLGVFANLNEVERFLFGVAAG